MDETENQHKNWFQHMYSSFKGMATGDLGVQQTNKRHGNWGFECSTDK
jgi:hypothetical protein